MTKTLERMDEFSTASKVEKEKANSKFTPRLEWFILSVASRLVKNTKCL